MFENRCVLFIFVDESTFEHFSYEIFLPLLICQHIIIPTMNFPESVNNCWIYPFILLKLCLQWLAFVQHFLPFVRKFQQQAMFKFYHFNNIQPPVQRKCRKITSQNQWISLCRGSQWCLEGLLTNKKVPGSEANRNKRNVCEVKPELWDDKGVCLMNFVSKKHSQLLVLPWTLITSHALFLWHFNPSELKATTYEQLIFFVFHPLPSGDYFASFS